MINDLAKVKVETNGISTHKYTLDAESIPHLQTILSNLYENPIKAFIRELSTNAADSHIAANNSNPIIITVPTKIEPVFRVQDFGVGLSKDDIYNVYTSYGKSLKRHSNLFNGTLGLGSKSPFTYSQQFTVSAVKSGNKCMFIMALGEDAVPTASLVYEGFTDEPNGVVIEIPIKTEDIETVCYEIGTFFRWFEFPVKFEGVVDFEVRKNKPQYTIHNIVDNVDKVEVYGENESRHYGGTLEAHAICMSNVLYPINLELFDKKSINVYGTPKFVIYVPNGSSFSFTPSRENLLYDAKTTKFVIDTINKAYAKFKELIKQELEESYEKDGYYSACILLTKLNKQFEFNKRVYDPFSISAKDGTEVLLTSMFTDAKHFILYSFDDIKNRLEKTPTKYFNYFTMYNTPLLKVTEGMMGSRKLYNAIKNYIIENKVRYITIPSWSDVDWNDFRGVPSLEADKLIEEYYTRKTKANTSKSKSSSTHSTPQIFKLSVNDTEVSWVECSELPQTNKFLFVELNGLTPVSNKVPQTISRQAFLDIAVDFTKIVDSSLPIYGVRKRSLDKLQNKQNAIPFFEYARNKMSLFLESNKNNLLRHKALKSHKTIVDKYVSFGELLHNSRIDIDTVVHTTDLKLYFSESLDVFRSYSTGNKFISDYNKIFNCYRILSKEQPSYPDYSLYTIELKEYLEKIYNDINDKYPMLKYISFNTNGNAASFISSIIQYVEIVNSSLCKPQLFDNQADSVLASS